MPVPGSKRNRDRTLVSLAFYRKERALDSRRDHGLGEMPATGDPEQ